MTVVNNVNNIPSFTCICNSTRKKHRRARRGSGGIAVYVKNCISKGLSNLSSRHSDIVWIKLDSKLFNLNRDVFIVVVYFSPENSSSCTEDKNVIYSRLLRNIEHYNQHGDIVIQGDFNAYTNTVSDFVISDNTEFLGQLTMSTQMISIFQGIILIISLQAKVVNC